MNENLKKSVKRLDALLKLSILLRKKIRDFRMPDVTNTISYFDNTIISLEEASDRAIDAKRHGKYDDSIESYNCIIFAFMKNNMLIPTLYMKGIFKTLVAANYFKLAFQYLSFLIASVKDDDFVDPPELSLFKFYRDELLELSIDVIDNDKYDLVEPYAANYSGNPNYKLFKTFDEIHSDFMDIRKNKKDVPYSKKVETFIKIGDVVKFGKYYQNSAKKKDYIEWIVLDEREDSLLLFSKYILDAKPYNDKLVDVTWETCTLRKWLNNDFLKKAFLDEDLKYILETKVVTPSNRDPLRITINGIGSFHGSVVSGGNNTLDKIFLLSWEETIRYFPEHADSKNKIRTAIALTSMFEPRDMQVVARVLSGIASKGTKYAIGHNLDESLGHTTIWFRSPGNTSQMAVTNLFDDTLYRPGCEVNDETNGVRPALWVKKEAFSSNKELKDELDKNDEIKTSESNFLKAKNAFEILNNKEIEEAEAEAIFKEIIQQDANSFLGNFGMACVENYRQISSQKIMDYLNMTMIFSKQASEEEKKILKQNIDFRNGDSVFENEGSTLLITAVRSNGYEIVKFLLENGANPNLATQKERGMTALFFAALGAAQGNDISLKIGEILMNYGADVFAKTSDGYTIFGNEQNMYSNGCKLNANFEQMVRRKYKEAVNKKLSEHPEEKQALENKKSICLEEIKKNKSKIDLYEQEIHARYKKLDIKREQKRKISIFKIKERRKINREIKEIANEIRALNIANSANKEDCLSKIKLSESKIADIDATLNGEIKLSY